jgi:hypothetical protein
LIIAHLPFSVDKFIATKIRCWSDERFDYRGSFRLPSGFVNVEQLLTLRMGWRIDECVKANGCTIN